MSNITEITYTIIEGNLGEGYTEGVVVDAAENAIRSMYPSADITVDYVSNTSGTSNTVWMQDDDGCEYTDADWQAQDVADTVERALQNI